MEESRELVLVLDDEDRVVGASRLVVLIVVLPWCKRIGSTSILRGIGSKSRAARSTILRVDTT